MEPQHRDDQPVHGYPNTAAATSGNPTIGYPISQFHLPVTGTTYSSAPASAATAAARTTRSIGDPSTCNTIKKATKLLFYILFPLAILSVAVVMIVAAASVPKLPRFALTSVSTTVRNSSDYRITADFDASFLVKNRAKEGLEFDHLTAYAFGAEPAGPLAPFELRSGEGKTVSSKINAVSYRIDEWDGVAKSGSSQVEFGAEAEVLYRGKTWSNEGIPIRVSCESVKVPLSYNASSTNFGEYSGFCRTDGQWVEDAKEFKRMGICFFAAFIATIVIYCLTAIYS